MIGAVRVFTTIYGTLLFTSSYSASTIARREFTHHLPGNQVLPLHPSNMVLLKCDVIGDGQNGNREKRLEEDRVATGVEKFDGKTF